jgi:hypothetical protein
VPSSSSNVHNILGISMEDSECEVINEDDEKLFGKFVSVDEISNDESGQGVLKRPIYPP